MDDLRIPIGLLFTLLGLLVITVAPARGQVDAGPVNLYSGVVMLVFGVVMLWLGRRAVQQSGKRN